MALSYPPSAPQRGDRTTFAARVDAFITWLIGFVSELIAVVANLNSIAAGGAYSIQYTYRSSSSFVGSATGGILAIKAASIQLDTKSLGGASVAALLSATGDSTSTLKGFIRLQKVNDTSKWAVYSVTSYAQGGSGLYGDIFGTLVNSSTGSNPFSDGESVMLFFDRTGDKGDTNSGVPTLHLREERASGTGSTTPTNLSAGVYRRPLNATKVNTVTGASLASDQFVLPIGTYDITAESLSLVSTGTTNLKYWHKMALYNVTDGVYVVIGQNGLSHDAANAGNYVQMTPPTLLGTFSVSGGAKTFELRHLTPNAVMSSAPAATAGQVEVYTDLIIRKTS
jgi:hypothetical protein